MMNEKIGGKIDEQKRGWAVWKKYLWYINEITREERINEEWREMEKCDNDEYITERKSKSDEKIAKKERL